MSDIMVISRHRMGTDGKGVTTLVGFYGCPLNCKYCVNNYCHHPRTVRADYSPEELLKVLSVDEPYFLMSGGGVTFGGGEPLMQAKFIHDLCSKMNPKWRKTIETSLYAPWTNITLLINDIDYWYIDIKDVNAEIYKKYTGKNNKIVIENLIKLAREVTADKICVRVPLIPDFNTKESCQEGIDYIRSMIASDIAIDMFEYIRF